jgi:hypothetical protein
VEVTIVRRRGTRGGNDPRDSLFLSFTLSFSSVMAAGAGAMMAEATEERDVVAVVVAAVVVGHGAGWLASWSRHLFSRRTGLDSLTPCMHDL